MNPISKLFKLYFFLANNFTYEVLFGVIAICTYKMVRDDLDNPLIHFDAYFMTKLISCGTMTLGFVILFSIDLYIFLRARKESKTSG